MRDDDVLPRRTIETLERRGTDASHLLRGAHLTPPPFDPHRRLPPSGLGVGVMVAMVVLVVAAGAMVVAANRAGEPQHQGIAGSVGDLAPLVPTWLPDGLTLMDAGPTPVSESPSDEPFTIALYGLDASADPHDGPILTAVRGRVDDQVARDWVEGATEIEVAGVEAWLDETIDGPALSWIANGELVALAGRWLDADDLTELAADLVTDPDALATQGSWRPLHQTETTMRELVGVHLLYWGEPALGRAQFVSITWHQRGHRSFDVLRAAHQGDPDCAPRSLVACGVRQVEVRGQPALVHSGTVEDVAQSSLAWIEPDGRVVTIRGVGIGESDLMDVAEGMRLGNWEELQPDRPDPVPPTDTTDVEPGGPPLPGAHPGRDVAAARALVGDARLQIRPVLATRGQRDEGWPPSPSPPPFDQAATLGGVAVDGWYPGIHELGPAHIDGTALVDAHPLPAPTNAFGVRGDRLWLQFGPDGTAALAELVALCLDAAPTCPTGQLAVVWRSEVVAVARASAEDAAGSITVEIGSWQRERFAR